MPVPRDRLQGTRSARTEPGLASLSGPSRKGAPKQGERLRFALSPLELRRPWLRSREDAIVTTTLSLPLRSDDRTRANEGAWERPLRTEVLRALLLCVGGPGVRCSYGVGGLRPSGPRWTTSQCSLPSGEGLQPCFHRRRKPRRPPTCPSRGLQ